VRKMRTTGIMKVSRKKGLCSTLLTKLVNSCGPIALNPEDAWPVPVIDLYPYVTVRKIELHDIHVIVNL
jgi:hypothetical protein